MRSAISNNDSNTTRVNNNENYNFINNSFNKNNIKYFVMHIETSESTIWNDEATYIYGL